MKPQAVYLAAYPNAEAEKVVAQLRRVHALSSGQHHLVEGPEQASLILVGGIGNEMAPTDYIRQTMHNPLIDRFPEKCFTISHRDNPIVFNRGVYESAQASVWTNRRCITGCYELSGHDTPLLKPDPTRAKDLLFSFVGRNSHPCRDRLLRMRFRRPDTHLEETSSFLYWSAQPEERTARADSYAAVMARSRFCVCPRGAGVGSIRLFEAMRCGVAPVIVADGWMPSPGIPWSTFSLRLREAELPLLERRVLEREGESVRMGRIARAVWEQNFAAASYFDYIVRHCVRIQATQRVPERVYWMRRHAIVAKRSMERSAQQHITAIPAALHRRLQRTDSSAQ